MRSSLAMTKHDTYTTLVVAFLTLLLLPFIACISGIFVFFLWNWLMPAIFGWPIISFWQAVGLSWLCSILFKSSNSSSDSK